MHRIILPFLISFILLMVVIALNRITYDKQREYAEQTEHSRNVIRLYDNLAVQLRSAEIYTPTYDSSPAKKLYAIYKSELEQIEPSLSRLRDSVNDNKIQVGFVDSISVHLKRVLPTLRQKKHTGNVGHSG